MGNTEKHLIDMFVDRGAYICQSQSLNLWQEDPSYKSLTGNAFLRMERTQDRYLLPKKKTQQQPLTTIDPSKIQQEENEVCEYCSG